MREGHDPSAIICRVPDGSLADFSYVGEHVSDDTAVGVLERLLQSVQAVASEGKVPGDWERRLIWLNDVLSEVWVGRGPFPGLGSVLQYLGMQRGTAFQRTLARRAARGDNIWQYVEAVLNGKRTVDETEYKRALKDAAERWQALPAARRRLLSVLARMELTSEQVHRVSNPDERALAGIRATDDELVANPYLICEQDQGGSESDPIALETVDHGMSPGGDAARFLAPDDVVAQDDVRRVRAVATTVLKEAASAGDTLLPFQEALNRVAQRFPDRRACRTDRDVVVAQADFYRETLAFDPTRDPPIIALQELADAEALVRTVLGRRVTKKNPPVPAGVDWAVLLDRNLGAGKGTALAPDVEKRARAEKIEALNTLYERRFSVLMGRAGTGKTSVLEVFLDGLEKIEGKRPVLLLASRHQDTPERCDDPPAPAEAGLVAARDLHAQARGRLTGKRAHCDCRRSIDDPHGPHGRAVPCRRPQSGPAADLRRRPEPTPTHRARAAICGHYRVARGRCRPRPMSRPPDGARSSRGS